MPPTMANHLPVSSSPRSPTPLTNRAPKARGRSCALGARRRQPRPAVIQRTQHWPRRRSRPSARSDPDQSPLRRRAGHPDPLPDQQMADRPPFRRTALPSSSRTQRSSPQLQASRGMGHPSSAPRVGPRSQSFRSSDNWACRTGAALHHAGLRRRRPQYHWLAQQSRRNNTMAYDGGRAYGIAIETCAAGSPRSAEPFLPTPWDPELADAHGDSTATPSTRKSSAISYSVRCSVTEDSTARATPAAESLMLYDQLEKPAALRLGTRPEAAMALVPDNTLITETLEEVARAGDHAGPQDHWRHP